MFGEFSSQSPVFVLAAGGSGRSTPMACDGGSDARHTSDAADAKKERVKVLESRYASGTEALAGHRALDTAA